MGDAVRDADSGRTESADASNGDAPTLKAPIDADAGASPGEEPDIDLRRALLVAAVLDRCGDCALACDADDGGGSEAFEERCGVSC